MPTDRSDKAYEYWREASQRFDYFITGLTGALTAYMGQTIKPHQIGLNPESLELLAIMILIGSLITGFKRIETTITIFKVMHDRLYNEEARGSLLTASQQGTAVINEASGDIIQPNEVQTLSKIHQTRAETAQEKLNVLTASSKKYYDWRNWLLILGFFLLVAARILPAYLP